ncbi:MAG: dihydroorotate dehydrogenase [Rickettsiales bacterium]|jgi:dihydroorotate dehydrogenase (NAD+) catalytic subunit|nr:dihydroorotate dehydrogenase [Rickettsiales bacterium]
MVSENPLEINLGGFKLKSPLMLASGTAGYGDELGDFFDVSLAGALVVKGTTLKPRPGNDGTRLFETYGGLINRIGLENIGLERFIKEKAPILQAKNINYIVNIAGSSEEEYVEMAKMCEKAKIKAIEANVSCPNVNAGRLEFGVDENLLFNLLRKMRQEFSGFISAKLTPNVGSIEKMAEASQRAGSNAISAINTLKGLGIGLSFDGKKFIKKEVQGGLSGRAIKPVALSMVKRVCSAVDIPVIGVGGIYSLWDVFEFFSAGAEAVQIGTANFLYPDLCKRITEELQSFIRDNEIANVSELKKLLREKK